MSEEENDLPTESPQINDDSDTNDDGHQTRRMSSSLQSLEVMQPEEKENPDEDIPESLTRNLFDRICGKMRTGSLRGSIFAMTSLSIGTGCLSFTKKVIQFGFVWFGVFLIISAFAIYWSLVGMIRVSRKHGDLEYSSSVKKILGNIPALSVDIMTALYSFGIIITYQVIIFTLVGRTVYEFFIDKDIYTEYKAYEEYEWNTPIYNIIVLLVISLLLIPLCLAKDIGKMKFFSLFGIIALFYTIIVLIVQCPLFFTHYLNNVYKSEDKSTHANWFDITRSFNSDLDFFTGFATVIFSFACHQGAFPVFRTLKKNNDRRIKKVFRRSIILDLCIYFLIYISSFLTTPLESEDLIIFRKSIFENDIFMNIAKISIIFELFFLIPSNFNSLRCSLFHLIFGNEDVETVRNIVLTLVTLCLSSLIGACYKGILTYISLLGGFCCTTICFLIPGSMIIKCECREMKTYQKVLNVLAVIVLCLLGFIGGIESVIQCFKG